MMQEMRIIRQTTPTAIAVNCINEGLYDLPQGDAYFEGAKHAMQLDNLRFAMMDTTLNAEQRIRATDMWLKWRAR